MEKPLSIRDRFVGIGDETAKLKQYIQSNLEGAVGSCDMDYVEHVVERYKRVAKLEQALGVISDELEVLIEEYGGESVGDHSKRDSDLREIRVEITQGMINQKYISLTEAKKAGLVEVGDRFRIDIGEGIEVETNLINPGNKFQNRSFVQSFFEKNGVKAGDYIQLAEREDKTWEMSYKRGSEVRTYLEEKLGL